MKCFNPWTITGPRWQITTGLFTSIGAISKTWKTNTSSVKSLILRSRGNAVLTSGTSSQKIRQRQARPHSKSICIWRSTIWHSNIKEWITKWPSSFSINLRNPILAQSQPGVPKTRGYLLVLILHRLCLRMTSYWSSRCSSNGKLYWKLLVKRLTPSPWSQCSSAGLKLFRLLIYPMYFSRTEWRMGNHWTPPKSDFSNMIKSGP